MANKYKLTVGIECHVQLNTITKLFSGADNDAKQAEPNTLINHIDFGLPGALPVLNNQAIEKAVRAAFALNTSPTMFSTFDRKHYFYPDLPMGYQITQYYQPIITGGDVQIMVDGKLKTIGITRAHLEADAGKSLHPANSDHSLVDLNRAGTPLLEIVSEPDLSSAIEARIYATELWLLMRFAGITEGNLFYGNMRFDVNVSVSNSDKLGVRVEVKNLNSFRSVEKAVDYEEKRQIDLLNSGQEVVQETRGWDDDKQKTFSQRSKENTEDYRYMPDPDLPPVTLSNQYLSKVKADMPVLPSIWRDRLTMLDLSESIINSLLVAEADYLTDDLDFICSLDKQVAKSVANMIVNSELPLRSEAKVISIGSKDRHELYLEVYKLIDQDKLSSSSSKQLLQSLLVAKSLPESVEEYAIKNNLIQDSNEDYLLGVVKKVLIANQEAANDVRNGQIKAIGFLVGQVMKESKSHANPVVVQKLIKKELSL